MTGICEGRVCVVTGAGSGDRPRPRRGAGRRRRARSSSTTSTGARGGRRRSAALHGVGGDAVGHVGDVSTGDGRRRPARAPPLDRWGRLDVVVNNAGITRDRMLVNLSESDWDDVLRVHLKSTFLVDPGGRPGTGGSGRRPATRSTPG